MKRLDQSLANAAVARWLAFFLIWIVLIGYQPGDLVAGAIAAALSAWVSLRLLPPGTNRLRLGAAAALTVRFLWQSVAAGWDVARRVFHPRLPIKPGFVRYPTRLPPGNARNLFASMTSLLPGTVEGEREAEALVYHCLDLEQPMAEQLAAADEGVFSRTFRRPAAGGGDRR